MMDKFIVLAIIILLVNTGKQQERVTKKAEKVINKFYEIENFSKELISIDKNLNECTPSEFAGDNFFKVIHNKEFKGYAYIGNAASMTASFDYLVLFDERLIITKSSVLIYREEYGGEIGSKRWLKQFIGKKGGNTLDYGNEIVAISGATISATSMTKAMNDILISVKILQTKGKL